MIILPVLGSVSCQMFSWPLINGENFESETFLFSPFWDFLFGFHFVSSCRQITKKRKSLWCLIRFRITEVVYFFTLSRISFNAYDKALSCENSFFFIHVFNPYLPSFLLRLFLNIWSFEYQNFVKSTSQFHITVLTVNITHGKRNQWGGVA